MTQAAPRPLSCSSFFLHTYQSLPTPPNHLLPEAEMLFSLGVAPPCLPHVSHLICCSHTPSQATEGGVYLPTSPQSLQSTLLSTHLPAEGLREQGIWTEEWGGTDTLLADNPARPRPRGTGPFRILTVSAVETTKAKWATASQQRTRMSLKSQKKSLWQFTK